MGKAQVDRTPGRVLRRLQRVIQTLAAARLVRVAHMLSRHRRPEMVPAQRIRVQVDSAMVVGLRPAPAGRRRRMLGARRAARPGPRAARLEGWAAGRMERLEGCRTLGLASVQVLVARRTAAPVAWGVPAMVVRVLPRVVARRPRVLGRRIRPLRQLR